MIDQLADLKARVARLEAKVARLERALSAREGDRAGAELALSLPPRPDAKPPSQRFPKCWHDKPVREAVIRLHRQMPIEQAREVMIAEFGHQRSPSRSALHRIWQRLDQRQNVN